MKTIKMQVIKSFCLCLLLVCSGTLWAQEVENETQTRTEFKLSYNLLEKLTICIAPELRYDASFFLDKYLLEGEAEYELMKNFELGVGYRFIANRRAEKETEYFNRIALKAAYSLKLNDFKPSVALKYTNYSEEGPDDKYIRLKGAVDYKIKSSKLTPYVSAELYRNISDGTTEKLRYGLGGNYKLFKNNYLKIGYKFDYYLHQYLNKHIFTIGYKIKL